MIQNPFCSHNAVVRWEFPTHQTQITTRKHTHREKTPSKRTCWKTVFIRYGLFMI